MQQADLEQIQAWFDGYLNGYLDLDPEGLKNIRLKQEHTAKVVEVMGLLAVGERLTASETCLARAVALLHDV
ncbi:MAG: HD family phosphohydrolase, partial [Geobacter sp.]